MASMLHSLFFYVLLLQFVVYAYGIKCYHCNSTSTIGDCVQAGSSLETKECPKGQVCVTYQYDVYLNSKRIGTSTSRGCEKNKNYCGTIEDLLNVLVKPAEIRERKCHLCDEDMCNSSSNVQLSTSVCLFLLITFSIYG